MTSETKYSFLKIWKIFIDSSFDVKKYGLLYLLTITLNKVFIFAIAYIISLTLLSSENNLIKYGSMYLLFKLLEWLFFVLKDHYMTKTRGSIIENVSNKIIEGVFNTELSKKGVVSPTELYKKADLRAAMRNLVGFSINHFLTIVVEIGVSCFIIYKIGGSQTDFVIINLIVTISMLTLAGKLISYRKIKDKDVSPYQEVIDNQNLLITSTKELFSKIYISKVFNSENLYLDVRKDLVSKELSSLTKFRNKAIFDNFIMVSISSISFIVMYFTALEKLSDGSLDKTVFASIMVIIFSLYWKINNIAYIFEQIGTYPEVMSYGLNAMHNKSSNHNRKLPKINDLEFKNVNVSINDRKILKDISFKVKKGETLYIVGESGAGKTTLFNVLLERINVESGDVFWGDESLFNFKNLVAWVPQDTIIKGGEADFNLTIGKEDASIEEKVVALKKANIYHRINESNLNEHLDSKVLSGGEMQRFAIARAFLSNRQLLVLDEPSSALDLKTEKIIFNELNNIKDVTKLIIIHRLLAIPEGSNIIVLNKGEVAEYGTLEELISNGGVFSKLYSEATYEIN